MSDLPYVIAPLQELRDIREWLDDRADADGQPDGSFRPNEAMRLKMAMDGFLDHPSLVLVTLEEVVEALQGCISYRNWQIAAGGPVPQELQDVWKQAETILSRLKTMNEGERP
jgi:hypothetical protein